MERKLGEKASPIDRLQVFIAQVKRLGFRETPGIRGEATLIVRDAKTMHVLREQCIRNILTEGGLSLFAQAMKSPFETADKRYYWYLVLGTGSGTPSASDTGLFTPVAASVKHGTISQTGAQYQYYVRYLPEDANGYTYTEAGIYDHVGYTDGTPKSYDTGTLLNHLMLTPNLTKDATILVDFYVTITFS